MTEEQKNKIEKFRDSLYSAMRSQEQDVEVNGATHPGLLEPMREILRGLYSQFGQLVGDLMLADDKDRQRTIALISVEVMALLWRREQYNGVGPDYDSYREGTPQSMGGRVEKYEREAGEIARKIYDMMRGVEK